MSVSLQPSGQLGFPRPLTQLVKRSLSVTNSNSQPVAFKVKTTAPKQYCVRPNSGRIEPGQTVEVQVLLQPMKEDPPPGTKCRDKFLVQSVIITPEREAVHLPELWSAIEKEDKTSIHEQKIRCAYLPAADTSQADSPSVGPGSNIENRPDPSSADALDDESRFATVRPVNGNTSAAVTTPSTPSASTLTPSHHSTPAHAQQDFSTPSNSHVLADRTKDAIAGVASAVGLESVAEKVSPSAPLQRDTASTTAASSSARSANELPVPRAITDTESTHPATASAPPSLSRELEEARAEISRLRSALNAAEKEKSGLRQRGIPASSGGSVPGTAQAVVEQKVEGGVPIQIVAGIAFGVFVLTWLFF